MNITEEEKNRILKLHESYRDWNGSLIKEQVEPEGEMKELWGSLSAAQKEIWHSNIEQVGGKTKFRNSLNSKQKKMYDTLELDKKNKRQRKKEKIEFDSGISTPDSVDASNFYNLLDDAQQKVYKTIRNYKGEQRKREFDKFIKSLGPKQKEFWDRHQEGDATKAEGEKKVDDFLDSQKKDKEELIKKYGRQG